MNYIRNGTKMNNLRTREVEIKEERDFPWVKIKKKKKNGRDERSEMARGR